MPPGVVVPVPGLERRPSVPGLCGGGELGGVPMSTG
jgi:hypothetical protein